jgi:hypothetical protein
MLILREQLEELFQKNDELVCHLIKFMGITVCVDIAETNADWVVDEKEIRELVP